MERDVSEALMMLCEASYLEKLRAKVGDDLDPRIIEVMSGLYQAGWRDCENARDAWEDTE